MANPITVFNTDILTTISSVEYIGTSGVNVDNENRIISLDENALSAVSSVDNKLDISSFNTYSGVVDNQITALRHDLDTVSTNTGYLYNDLTSTSAGLSGAVDYISGAVDYVSGSLTSKQDKLTEEQLSAISSISSLDTKFYPLNENPSGYLTNADTTDLMSASLLEISDNKITAYNGTAFAGQDDGPNADLSGVNIDISLDPTSSYIVLSAKDYTDDITAIGNDLSYVSGKVDSVSSELSGAVDYVSANIGDAFTGVNVNIPLTGDGKTSALGLMNYISWGGNGTTSTFTRSGVRVLDENNNSAYYLASGLNLNNESITDSAISSWNDTKTTVETNSANWGGITSVDTNHGISGNGTTSTPIGIASSFQLENPSVYTTATYKGDSIGIEGMFPRIQLKTDNSSYNTLGEGGMTITHSASGVGGGYTTSHYGSTMRLSYNDGDYYLHTMDTTKSGLGVAYKGNSNVKAYYNYSGVALTNDNGATNEYVNVSSIRNWNDVYDTVSSNSASWTGGGGSIDTLPFFVQEPLVTGISGSSAYIALTGGTDNTAYVPYSAISSYYSDGYITYINGSGIYADWANNSNYSQTAYYDLNGNEITSYYQPTLTFGVSDNTITSINNTAVGGGTPTATWELVEGNNISIVDNTDTSSTTISVSGISANEWNDVYDTVSSNSSNWGGGGSVGDYLTATDSSSISSFKFSNNLQVSPYEVYKGATISGYGLGDNEEAGNFVLNGRVLGLSSRGHYGWGDNNVGVVFTPWHISGDNYVLSSDGLKFSWYDSTIQDMNTWKAITANTAGVASANDFVTQNGVSLSSLNSATEWNETYNAVNTNSGTWGGSALNISAGSGVKAELVGDTLVFSNDETVLWSGVASNTGNLDESIENFDTIKVNYITDDGMQGVTEFMPNYNKAISLNSMYVAQNSAVWFKATNYTFSSNTSFSSYPYQLFKANNAVTAAWTNNTGNTNFRITRVIGINRKQV